VGTTAKDITSVVVALVANADVAVGIPNGDDADNGLRDPVRCVMLDGSCTYRIAVATRSSRPRTSHSNRAADTDGAKNPWGLWLGDGPRTLRRQVEPR